MQIPLLQNIVIIKMNLDTVREERKKGEPVLYGEATQEALLEHAHVKDARAEVADVFQSPGELLSRHSIAPGVLQ